MNVKTLLLATTALMIAAPSLAMAETTTIETVVVTARKKSEELLKVPVAISALTSKDIETRGIESMGDVANFTPGINVDSTSAGGARADRSFQTIIIRGMNPSSTQNPTAALFIDGVPVDSDFVQNLDDVARVEVLKGPQSAFFGRTTFAGAINVITRDPSNTLGGSISAEVGSHDTRAFKGNISGPIIPDVLTFRAGAFYNGHDGSYNNPLASGQTLGAQTTKGVNLALTFKPTSKLTIKASGQFFEDNDGPGATGLILNTNCLVGNSAFGPNPYYCGTLPGLTNSPAANTTKNITGPFGINAGLATAAGKIIKPSDAVKGYGLKRDGYHGALSINYDLPYGLTLTSLTGATYQDWSEVSDLSNLAKTGYTGFPYLVEETSHEFSQELRLATDQTQPLRGLLGLSYVESKTQQDRGFAGFSTAFGPNGAKTSGIFFSVAYDILPKVTINVDGRYQIDDIAAYQALNPGAYLYTGTTKNEGKFRNFLPRVSVQYKVTPDVMTYFTYSEGVNPGAFNSLLTPAAGGLTVAGLNYLATTYGAGVQIKPENLNNYELGIKGRFWGGKATLSADIYYDKWTNQIVSQNVLVTDPTLDASASVAHPALEGFYNNGGKSTYSGVEVDGKFLPIDHVSVNVSAAYTGTRYDTYLCGTGVGCYSGTVAPYLVQAGGKQAPNVSKFSASIGAQYSNTLSYYGGVDYFVRGDFVYKSGLYVASDNLAQTPDLAQFNLRAGLSKGSVAVDAYVNNLFDNRSPTSVIPNFNFSTFGPAFMTALPELRTFGMKVKYTF